MDLCAGDRGITLSLSQRDLEAPERPELAGLRSRNAHGCWLAGWRVGYADDNHVNLPLAGVREPAMSADTPTTSFQRLSCAVARHAVLDSGELRRARTSGFGGDPPLWRPCRRACSKAMSSSQACPGAMVAGLKHGVQSFLLNL